MYILARNLKYGYVKKTNKTPTGFINRNPIVSTENANNAGQHKCDYIVLTLTMYESTASINAFSYAIHGLNI